MYRKRYGRRRPAKTMKKKLNRLARKVGKLSTDVEVKQFTQFGTTPITSNFNAVFIQVGTALQQGTSWNERVGREVKPTHLSVRFNLNGPTTPAIIQANTIYQPYRIIVFQDVLGNVTPQATELLISGDPPVGGRYDSINSSYNPDYVCHKGDRKNRYKILGDKRGYLAPRISAERSSTTVSFSIPGSRMSTINYADATSGGARAGKLYAMLILGVSATSSDNCDANSFASLKYTDA